MKVLVAHNQYRSDVPSGENVVVDAEIEALREAGVDVVPWLPSSDDLDLRKPRGLVEAAMGPVHAPWGARTFARLLAEHRPDVVHLHNVYPLIGPQVVRQAHHAGVPVVMTVHNFRLTCMAGSHFRDGAVCTKCTVQDSPMAGLAHGCYRASRAQSLPMAAGLTVKLLRGADMFVAPSRFIGRYLEGIGVEADKIMLRPHWLDDMGPVQRTAPRSGLLFVGRLTPEKGVPELLAAVERLQPPWPLTLVGDGPMRRTSSDRDAVGVRFTGTLAPDAVAEHMSGAEVLVAPSVVEESFGLVVVEALRAGLPVLAADRGALPEVVGDAGWACEPTEQALKEALAVARNSDLYEYSARARKRYEAHFTRMALIDAQIAAYEQLVRNAV